MKHAPVVTPIIHLNGDRKETLLANLEQAYLAIRDAEKALCQCVPNGRNFYPEPGRLQQAEAQHRERQAHLRAVRESLEAECCQIEDETRR